MDHPLAYQIWLAHLNLYARGERCRGLVVNARDCRDDARRVSFTANRARYLAAARGFTFAAQVADDPRNLYPD